MCLTADPGREFDPGRSHTLAEIDHEIIPTAILLPSADSRRLFCQVWFLIVLIPDLCLFPYFVVSYKPK